MSTVHSSTERSRLSVRSTVTEAQRSIRDVVPLLQFRSSGLRGRSRAGVVAALVVIGVVTVLAGWLPVYLPGAAGAGRAVDALLLLPTAYIGVLVIAIISAAASGGGRELLPRDQAVAYPVSATTDHLGALLLAPLNIAWLLQGWTVLGMTAYVVGSSPTLVAAQLPVLLWLFVATALAQAAAWAVEWVRRGRRGRWTVRVLVAAFGAAVTVLVATDQLVSVLDRSLTVRIALGALYGAQGMWMGWFTVVAVLFVIGVLAVVVGGFLANAVSRRPAHDELRVESSVHTPRTNPGSDFIALLRVDRVGVWRSVSLRRGLLVLAVLPGLVAVAGALEWSMVTILPGLVASGGALLFGVNAWCLDGRGALWRDSLPVSPRAVFTARVIVLVEILLLATLLTMALAALRAGVPTVAQLVAVLTAAVVVCVQVVASSLRWSIRRPFAVDLRSARATPAPPLVMVGYSARLALSTTLTGMLFGMIARFADWHTPLLVALPFLLFSAYKLVRSANEWATPEVRSRVVATVAS